MSLLIEENIDSWAAGTTAEVAIWLTPQVPSPLKTLKNEEFFLKIYGLRNPVYLIPVIALFAPSSSPGIFNNPIGFNSF